MSRLARDPGTLHDKVAFDLCAPEINLFEGGTRFHHEITSDRGGGQVQLSLHN